jgi:hypothetical protein
LETITAAHQKVSDNSLEMMKMSQGYSESMLKQISEHNLSIHRSLDGRLTSVETAVGRVQQAVNDLSERVLTDLKKVE